MGFGFIRELERKTEIKFEIPRDIYEEIWRFHSVRLYIAGFLTLNARERYVTLNYTNQMAYYYNKGDKYALESFYLSEITQLEHGKKWFEIKTKQKSIHWNVVCPSEECMQQWMDTLEPLMPSIKSAENEET